MPDSPESAFKRNAALFADHLSSLLTRTITDQRLALGFVYDREEGRLEAFIRFQDRERRPATVTVGNGCRIRVSQRVVDNPDDPRKVTTTQYSYACGFGENLDVGWLVRYEYVPKMAAKMAAMGQAFEYPVAHVHFNGVSDGYDPAATLEGKPLPDLHFPTRRLALEDFVEHLIVELGVPARRGKDAALDVLAKSRAGFEERRTR